MFSRDRLIKAIDNSACLTRRQVSDYINKRLYPEELYVVEMHLNECPFCNDAIEGFEKEPAAQVHLSQVKDFVFPGNSGQTEALGEGLVKNTPREVKPIKTEIPKETARKKEPVELPEIEQPQQSRKFMPIFLKSAAAGVFLVLGVAGFNKFFNSKGDELSESSMVADTDESSVLEKGMFNEDKIDRRQDSIMNAKFGFESQKPLDAFVQEVRYRYNADGSVDSVLEEENETLLASDISTGTEMAKAEKPAGFVGPVMPSMDQESKKSVSVAAAPVAAARTMASPGSASRTKESVAAVAMQSKAVAKNTEVPVKKAEQPVKKETATTKPTEEKKKAVSSDVKDKVVEKKVEAKEEQKLLAQAEKDYNKGLELYNKKQYAASIMYFQSASKVVGFNKKSQALSYVKLAKSEVVSAERKKNSEEK